jgi:Big-like domain-containing protein/flagellar hook capping protein FlgD
MVDLRGPNGVRGSFLLVAALIGALLVPTAVRGATGTTTTLEVPSGTQYGTFTVTAHVRPAPLSTNGFIPAAMFVIDDGGGLPAPLDGNGDASMELDLAKGTHTIVARFGPFEEWDASESAPATVTVGIGTSIALSSSQEPVLSTQPVTITATLSPSTATGGTLKIEDAFDGATLATASVTPGSTSVSFTGLLAIGSHPLTASYTGDGDYGPSVAHLTETVQADTGVTANGSVQFSTFYPYRDGYRDTNEIRGSLSEPASVLIRIYAPSGSLFRTIDLGHRTPGRYGYTWTGRRADGSLLIAGTYRIVQRITDDAANVKNVSSRVVLSHKRLRWTISSITLYGSQVRAGADPGNGYISTARSSYYRGVRLSSGNAGVAVAYRFTVRSALRYGNAVTFKVLGRSPNGTKVYEGLWDRTLCAPSFVDCYHRKSMGPSYGWWSIGGVSGAAIDARTAWGLVYVPYDGHVRSFDVAKVRFTYRWAVLG